MILNLLKTRLRRFARNTDGNTSVEAMIVFPALAVIFAASWVYFDVMRQQSINQKANYAIGDMISRETDMLNDQYITNARKLLFYMTQAKGTDVDLRVTVIQHNANNGSDSVIWSEKRGNWPRLNNNRLAQYSEKLPDLAHADQLILVETRDLYTPLFDIAGLGPFDITTYSFTRPRFSPQVIFEGVNDGVNGSGDGGDSDPQNNGT